VDPAPLYAVACRLAHAQLVGAVGQWDGLIRYQRKNVFYN
jgi:hypothetical protein